MSDDTTDCETENLMWEKERHVAPRSWMQRRGSLIHLSCLYFFIVVLLGYIGATNLKSTPLRDPSLGDKWTPVRDVVDYVPYEFHAFEDNGEYAGYPDDTKDQMWQDLFSFGMIRISEEESKNLVQPTFQIPNTDEYLIELEVFHQLHCLNQLRQAFYPERWPHLWQYTPEGKIDYAGRQYGHWEHCIESIRQSLICHSDVTPITIHYNATAVPKSGGDFKIEHTCRNFDALSDWARGRTLGLLGDKVKGLLDD
ncbi:hypothetical protein C7974DRAFT_420282 [Boeremia exigua]|uniref:uncharacterized protein n=1 Tax=Boeremia exigua TaxID=749465 RepID=UPI001E8D5B8A|nr:uncharacterized protein C7974DRAFT_420282 [Boeremia exigua]KAH6644865.1 hypothetical protein C7974DRAFT_420282 [Boeremia exigua]